MTPFWIAITALCGLAAIVNFALAVSNHAKPRVMGIRALAGVLSLLAVAGILVGKAANLVPVLLSIPLKVTAAGVFVFAVLFLPAALSGGDPQGEEMTLAKRAIRPTTATVRLKQPGSDEWIN